MLRSFGCHFLDVLFECIHGILICCQRLLQTRFHIVARLARLGILVIQIFLVCCVVYQQVLAHLNDIVRVECVLWVSWIN